MCFRSSSRFRAPRTELPARARSSGRRARLLLCAALAGLACASARLPQLPGPVEPRSRALDVPFYAQSKLQCGPAALAMALLWSGEPVYPGDLVKAVFTARRRGSLQADMVGGARRHGRIPYPVSTLSELLEELAAGHPVVVLQNLGLRWIPVWHYAVAVGYDLDEQTLLLHSGALRDYRVPLALFERTWARGEHWARVILPPDELPQTRGELPVLESIAASEEAGAWAAAGRAFERAAERWPTSARAWLGIGSTRYRGGDLPGAEAAFRRAAEIEPDLGPAWNNLAHVLAERGELAEARATLDRALALGGPWSALYLRTLGEIERR